MLEWKTKGTKRYQDLPKDLHETLKVCDPLREKPAKQKSMSSDFKTWGKTK